MKAPKGPAERLVLLAYPDNPVGKVFFETFQKYKLSICAVVVEEMESNENKGRLLEKIRKDGLLETLTRIVTILWMQCRHKTIVDLAQQHGVPVKKVSRFNSDHAIQLLTALKPDLLCIVSAPILKPAVFQTAATGCLNAHPGWLPAFRGIGANAHALMQGELPGVSVHFIDADIDQGALLKRERVAIKSKDTVAKINDRAVARGAEMMCESILALRQSSLESLDVSAEKMGPVYRAPAYGDVKRINRKIRHSGGKHAL